METRSVRVLRSPPILAAACAETVEYLYVGTEPIKSEKGTWWARKELLRDPRTGEQVEELTHYQPMHNEKGEIIAYQEPTAPAW
jgi:hypothetical protein